MAHASGVALGNTTLASIAGKLHYALQTCFLSHARVRNHAVVESIANRGRSLQSRSGHHDRNRSSGCHGTHKAPAGVGATAHSSHDDGQRPVDAAGISTSMWQHSLNDLCHEPSPPRSYEDLSDNNVLTPAFSAFSLGRADGVAQANRARGARRYQGAVPFERAVDTLCQALHSAMKHCKGIKDHFDKTIEASSIALWAPPRAVDALWTMNVEWDGVDRSRRAHFPEQQPAPEVVTFQGIIARFENAMKAMAHCSGPRLDYLEYADHKLSPEVFRNTLSKLKVTLKGVEELMQSVRKDRGLMEPLIKDLMAATQLLDDIGPLWVPRPRTTAAKSRRWMQEGDDHERPWYRGD